MANTSQYVIDRRLNPELMDVTDHLRLARAEEKRRRRARKQMYGHLDTGRGADREMERG